MAATKHTSLAEKVYLGVRDRILSGEYPLTAPLSRRALAQQFGVSLLPVAEALQRLEHEGLVESRPRSGTRVRVPNPDEIRGHYVVREALETQAARLFAEKSTARQKRRLASLARQVDALYNASPVHKMDRRHGLFDIHQAHFDFHMEIAQAAGCKELMEAIEGNQVLIFNWLYNSAAHFDTLPPRWHEDLVAALASGDPEKADRAMRRHVRYRRDSVADRIGAYLAALDNGSPGFRGPRAKGKTRK
ncbi:MAG: GntR family transcriptional regulator [Bryobacteraceae bacterium]